MSIPTPEQARELVEHFGGQGRAARGAGLARSTLRYWLAPVPARAAARRNYAADPARKRAAMRRWYADLDGYGYNRLLLRKRRHAALKRMAERNAIRGN